MSETQEIISDLCADARIILFLHDNDDPGLLQFIDAQYGLKFMTEQTGASFEDCIDWCAQNAGGIENAKRVLLLLFERFYLHLPRPVQADLLYLAVEVGFDPKPSNLHELKALCRAQIKRGASGAVSFSRLAWLLLSNMRLKLRVMAAARSAARQHPPIGPLKASSVSPPQSLDMAA